MYYVALDIGCIECGEPSSVLGIFTDKTKAEEVIVDHEKRQRETWRGQHSFEVHEIEKINKEYRLNYQY